jgi:hypothetical protein
MDDKQFKLLIDELSDIRNLLILNASKNGANSVEISRVLNTSDSRVRQILTANAGRKKRDLSKSRDGKS